MFWKRKPQLEAEIEAELHDHLERQIADYIAGGLSPEEARRRARLAFGGTGQIQEDCREVYHRRWLSSLARDLKYTLRCLRKSPGFAAVATLVLALGIGSNLAVFSLIDSLFLQP